jgi:hypothetical protein
MSLAQELAAAAKLVIAPASPQERPGCHDLLPSRRGWHQEGQRIGAPLRAKDGGWSRGGRNPNIPASRRDNCIASRPPAECRLAMRWRGRGPDSGRGAESLAIGG